MTEHEPLRPLSASQKAMLEEATNSYQAALTRDVEAARYLLDRGLGREAARTFRLGVVDDPAPGHERFRGMLAIPYLDKNGKALTVRFRCLRPHDHRENYHGKYNSLPEEPPRMFNVRAVFEAGSEIHVTEGEMDAMVLHLNVSPAVAIPGAHLWRGHHRRMLAGFSRVWVWGDPDEAGGEFAAKLVRSMRQAVPVKLEDGDVNETFLSGGAEALLDAIERSTPKGE